MAKKEEKHLTERHFRKFEKAFENNMANIAKSFARVDASLQKHEEVLYKHTQILQSMIGRLQGLDEDNKYFRGTLSSFVSDVSSHDRRIDHLMIRLERLEGKIK